jgi:glycerophosphoryl diester phosphodiesterase
MNPFWKVAHRGWHKAHVENTLEAFRAAYAAGCDMVEFDVQLTRDGVPVVFHDDDCLRLTGTRAFIYDLDWKAVQALTMPARPQTHPKATGAPEARAGGGKAGGQGRLEYKIPSLEQFLNEFGSKPFYLELKIPAAVSGNSAYVELLGDACARLVKAGGPHPDTFLGSFHAGILGHLAREKAFPILAGIFEDYQRFDEVYSGRDAETAAAIRYFSVSWDLFRTHVHEWTMASQRSPRRTAPARPGIPVRKPMGVPGPDLFLVWDVKDESEFRAALSHGVRGLVADDVETMIKL